MATLHYDRHEHTVVITMEGDNDLNLRMTGPELHERLAEYDQDDELRCCIVTGSGARAFSAGGNLKDTSDTDRRSRTPRTLWDAPPITVVTGLHLWKPIIAAVNGYAVGAGCMFALACDIRIASENAEFGIPEIKLGFPTGLGAAQRLPRLMPFGPALEMLLTGDRITAQQAMQWGLVNRVVPLSELMDSAMQLANRIAANPPLAVRGLKEMAYRSRDMALADGLRMSALMGYIGRETEDAKEGRQAFLEKRKPNFKGR